MNTKKIAHLYFKSWEEENFEELRQLLADDVKFSGPLAQVEGVEACVNGLRGLRKIITEIDIQHMWADESDVITWFHLHTNKTNKYLSVVNWSHIEDDLIKEIRVTFDPRPLLA